MNQIIIIGRLTKDPELSYTESGVPITRFSVAVNRPRVANKPEEADFFRVVTFKVLAENCSNYLSKGKLVAVSGTIRFGSYKDKDGGTRYTTDLLANQVKFLERKDRSEADQQADHGFTDSEAEEDTVPF